MFVLTLSVMFKIYQYLNISPDFLLTLVRIQNKVSEVNKVTVNQAKNRSRGLGIKNTDHKHTILIVSFSMPLI